MEKMTWKAWRKLKSVECVSRVCEPTQSLLKIIRSIKTYTLSGKAICLCMIFVRFLFSLFLFDGNVFHF